MDGRARQTQVANNDNGVDGRDQLFRLASSILADGKRAISPVSRHFKEGTS